MLTCVIIDHDKASLINAKSIVEEITHLKLIQSCENIPDAISVLQNNKTDILFIDMEGIKMNDLSFLNELGYDKPRVVVMALNNGSAKEAFDIDATDFILKPLTLQRTLKALSKIIRSPRRHNNGIRGAQLNSELYIKQNSYFLKIDLRNICHIEALADYVNLYTVGKRYTIHSTMKGIQSKLPERDFARVHKSYIVRVDRVSRIQGKSVIVEKHTIPVSNSFRKTFFERLNVL